jgi:hypothetical protein
MKQYVEVTNLFASVMGKIENDKKKIVRHRYLLTTTDIESALDKLVENFGNFETSVREIDKKTSTRFQAIGIEKARYDDLGNSNYVYRFQFRYVFREKRKLWATNNSNKISRPIEFQGEEFQSIVVCASFYLNTMNLVIDRRGTLLPLASFFKQSIFEYLDEREYGLANATEVENGLRINLKQELADDYEDKIKNYFSKIEKVSFSFAKPAKVRARNSSQSNSNAPDFVQNTVRRFFGSGAVRDAFIDLPIKSFSISVKIDTGYNKTQLNNFKKLAKNNILEQARAEYVTGGSVEFEKTEEDEELEKAIIRGVAKTDMQDVSYDPYDDEEKYYTWHDSLMGFEE